MPTETKQGLPVGVPSGAPSCSLSPADLGHRRRGLADLVAAAHGRVTADDGISLRFPFSEELLEAAWWALQAETSCCPDFGYVLTVEPSERTFELAVHSDVPGHARWLRTVYLGHPDTGASDG